MSDPATTVPRPDLLLVELGPDDVKLLADAVCSLMSLIDGANRNCPRAADPARREAAWVMYNKLVAAHWYKTRYKLSPVESGRLIYSPTERLYWNNTDGWGDRASATRFTEEEVMHMPYLPIGGQWVPVSHGTTEQEKTKC